MKEKLKFKFEKRKYVDVYTITKKELNDCNKMANLEVGMLVKPNKYALKMDNEREKTEEAIYTNTNWEFHGFYDEDDEDFQIDIEDMKQIVNFVKRL